MVYLYKNEKNHKIKKEKTKRKDKEKRKGSAKIQTANLLITRRVP